MYKGRHPGEIGVIIWTLVLLIMILICLTQGGQYKIQQNVVTTYVTVVLIFVITKASKQLFLSKKGKYGKRSNK